MIASGYALIILRMKDHARVNSKGLEVQMNINNLDLNKQFIDAYNLLENSKSHIFITGKAGTGKSTLLQYLREHTSKNIVVLAPTGVAAVNVKGQTIHSFFRFKVDITLERVQKIRLRKENREMYHNIDTIIIDEVSMLRADILDCVDEFLRIYGRKRKEAFGGIQMIFIGDLYQLPPVVTHHEEDIFRDVYDSPYFFSAKVFKGLQLDYIDLAKIYRQQDDEFVELLNAIRHKTATDKHMQRLNERCRPDFIPDREDFYVYLTTTNAVADRINKEQLNRLRGNAYRFEGTVEGKFESKTLPTHEILDLKLGAQVMLLNNDPSERWVNGTVGKIINVHEDLTSTDIVEVELEGGHSVEVTPFKWEMFRFFFNEDTQMIESQSVGAFTQYPLKLSWAITIHKSQGKTFSKVIVDIGHGAFAHGQTYVALSRCTKLEGLVLKRPILKHHILLDPRIARFMDKWNGNFSKKQS